MSLFLKNYFSFLCAAILFRLQNGFEVALFASSGCYSHDVMMREIGQEFESMSFEPRENNTTQIDTVILDNIQIYWIQIYIYDFGFDKLPKPPQWQSLILDVTENDDEHTKTFKLLGHKLLWYMYLPFDHKRPWDLRGAYFFFHILRWNHQYCQQFVKSPLFKKFLINKKIDFVVIDHFIQECFTAAAFLFGAPTVQFSNWPIADGYISSLNVPAPPSAYPKTATTFSPREMRYFLTRLWNTLWHCIISIARVIQAHLVNQFYASIGHKVDLNQLEARHLFYAGRAEFFSEPIRPISNRIKHFGCASCNNPDEYYILTPASMNRSFVSEYRQRRLYNKGKNVQNNTKSNSTYLEFVGNCSTIYTRNYLPKISVKSTKLMPKKLLEQYKKVRMDFPEIDWTTLEKQKFILVSFGSVAKVEFMPTELLYKFIRAFSRCSHFVIWQTNSQIEKISSHNLTLMTSNLLLVRWAPIKTLLAHPNLLFAILHGGVNTLNEALMFGKPILGLPLQGDQSSNLQRLVDLGMAELVDIDGVWTGQLRVKMVQMETNYAEYLQRAGKVSSMINFYRKELSAKQQHFWLRWAAQKRHTILAKGHNYFHFRYRTIAEYFALMEFSTILIFAFFICGLLSKK